MKPNLLVLAVIGLPMALNSQTVAKNNSITNQTNSSTNLTQQPPLMKETDLQPSCSNLFSSYICCADPEIDLETQQPFECDDSRTVQVPCFVLNGVRCDGKTHLSFSDSLNDTLVKCGDRFYNLEDRVWNETRTCYYLGDNPKSFYVALSLSVFFGMLGIDRFYLGYPALGLVKMCTGGMFLTWWLLDIILIVTHVLGPADGSSYLVEYYGPRMENTMVGLNNNYYYGAKWSNGEGQGLYHAYECEN